MKQIFKRVGRLDDGHYLVYYNLARTKFIYILTIENKTIHILNEYETKRMAYDSVDPALSYKVHFYCRRHQNGKIVHSTAFDSSEKAQIFQLTDEEFFLETVGDL